MTISKERLNELSFKKLMLETLERGVLLRPAEQRRDIHNLAKKLGSTPAETAECAKVFVEEAYKQTMAELDAIINELS